MRLLLLISVLFSGVAFCRIGEKEFARLPGPAGYELVAYESTKFGPSEYTAKIFLNQAEIARFVRCTDDYENATLFTLKCTNNEESLDLEIQWGDADTATQMHGTWVAGEQRIAFFRSTFFNIPSYYNKIIIHYTRTFSLPCKSSESQSGMGTGCIVWRETTTNFRWA